MRKLRVDVAATDAAGFFFAGPPPASRIAFVFRASAIVVRCFFQPAGAAEPKMSLVRNTADTTKRRWFRSKHASGGHTIPIGKKKAQKKGAKDHDGLFVFTPLGGGVFVVVVFAGRRRDCAQLQRGAAHGV
jgi:hypothetical protein